MVDAPNPELECPNADFPTIQAAVTAAMPGDTIEVCPGFYNESVTVAKTLVLEGAGRDPKYRTGDPTKEAVLTGPTLLNYGFSLEANSIEVRRFTIERFGGFVFDGVSGGIRTSAAFSGYVIEHNLLRANAFPANTVAIRLASNGALETRIGHNAFGNEEPGSRGDWGIVMFGLPPNVGNLTIEHNLFTRYDSHLINLQGGRDVRIHHNLMTHNGPNSATVLSRIQNLDFAHNRNVASREVFPTAVVGRIHHNAFEDAPFQEGISIFNANPELLVDNNWFENRLFGVVAVNQQVAGLRIEQNDIRESTLDGIRLGGRGTIISENNVVANARWGISVIGFAEENVIVGNRVTRNGEDGIALLFGANRNVVSDNDVQQNGRDGIHVSSSSGNVLERNHMKHNAGFDAFDDNRPANTWIDNKCETDSPPGTICES